MTACEAAASAGREGRHWRGYQSMYMSGVGFLVCCKSGTSIFDVLIIYSIRYFIVGNPFS